MAQPLVVDLNKTPALRRLGNDVGLGLLFGIAGGLLQATVLHSSLLKGALLGAGFGLIFGLVFSKQSSSAGAGLFWGLSRPDSVEG